MTDTVPSEIVWGTEVRRRQEGVPFLQYEPRRRSLPSLLEDAQPLGRPGPSRPGRVGGSASR